MLLKSFIKGWNTFVLNFGAVCARLVLCAFVCALVSISGNVISVEKRYQFSDLLWQIVSSRYVVQI